MRVKSCVAAAGVTVVAAVLALPGLSNASRLPNPGPSATAAPAVVDTTTTQPVATTTTTVPVVVEPTTAPPPVVTTTTTVPATPAVVTVPATAPVVVPPTDAGDAPVTVDTKKVDPPAPAAAPGNDGIGGDSPPADPCHMDGYQVTHIDTLTDQGEIARAQKVDRNGNGIVCRKEIPGHGRGNTGNGSNIKDDQAG